MICALAFIAVLGRSSATIVELPTAIRLVAVDEYYPRTSDVINPSSQGLIQDVADRHVLSFIFENVALPAGPDGPWYQIAMRYPGEAPYNVNASLVGSGTYPTDWGITVGWDGNKRAKFYIVVDKDNLPTAAHFSILKSWRVWNEITEQYEWYYDGWDPTLLISKVSATDAAIDTRKGYGQPNAEGQIMADANSELRNVWFGNWKWRGGLFAGNMPPNHDDRSGLARIQFWPSTLPSDILFATLTLMDLGAPMMPGGGSTGATTGETTGATTGAMTTGTAEGGETGALNDEIWRRGQQGSFRSGSPLDAIYACAALKPDLPRNSRAYLTTTSPPTTGGPTSSGTTTGGPTSSGTTTGGPTSSGTTTGTTTGSTSTTGTSSTTTGGTPAGIPILGVYVPLTDDPELDETESTVVWSTRWTIDPQGAGQGSGSGGTHQVGRSMRDADDYGTWNGTSETGGYYINWPVTWVDLSLSANPIYLNVPFQHGLCLAMVDEEDQLSTVVWRYFASREYDQLFAATQDFPNNDSKPRVWAIKYGDAHGWGPWSQFPSQLFAVRRPIGPVLITRGD